MEIFTAEIAELRRDNIKKFFSAFSANSAVDSSSFFYNQTGRLRPEAVLILRAPPVCERFGLYFTPSKGLIFDHNSGMTIKFCPDFPPKVLAGWLPLIIKKVR